MSDGQQILPEVDDKEATIEVTNHFGSTFEFQIVSDCSKENESQQNLTEEKNLSTRLDYGSYQTTL